MYRQEIKQIGSYIQIRGNNSWCLINKATIDHKIIDIVNCTSFGIGDLSALKFPNAEDVYFRGCCGNMIFFHLNPKKFPEFKNIYLDTNFEPEVYSRFGDDVNIYIADHIVANKPHYEKYQGYKYATENGCNYQVPYYYIITGRNRKLNLMTRSDIEDNILRSLNIKDKKFIE